MSGTLIDVTVIIATRNRAVTLRHVLDDLANQQVEGSLRYEVVVADNGSTDETAAIVGDVAAHYPVPLRLCHEPTPGKSHALNRGLAHADGTLLVFTDDDVVLPPTWLAALVRAVRDHDADGAGGPVHPLWISPRPAWLADATLRQLGMVDHGPDEFVATSTATTLIGPNCAYRKQLFERYGGYLPGFAQDAEWFGRVLTAGAKLVYQPAARIAHRIDGAQLTRRGLARRFLGHGYSYGTRLPVGGRAVCGVPVWVIRLYAGLHVKALAAWLRGDAAEGWWQWLRRSIYHGVMRARYERWRGVPVIQPPRVLAMSESRL